MPAESALPSGVPVNKIEDMPLDEQIARERLATLRTARALMNLAGLYLMLPFAALLVSGLAWLVRALSQ